MWLSQQKSKRKHLISILKTTVESIMSPFTHYSNGTYKEMLFYFTASSLFDTNIVRVRKV